MNTFCTCKQPYSPLYSHQRLCLGCNEWYDFDCLDPEPDLVEIPTDGDIQDILMQIPVYRGSAKDLDDRIEDHQPWDVVGTYFIRKHLQELEKQDSRDLGTIVDSKWDAILKEDLPSREWNKITCPTCHTIF